MSQENVVLFREGLKAWNEGNLEAILDLCDPEIEWKFSEQLPDAVGTIRGRAAVGEFLISFSEAWSEISLCATRIFDVDDHVLVDIEFLGRARDGIEVSMQLGHVWTGRNGLCVRFRAYASFDEALKAVGLEE